MKRVTTLIFCLILLAGIVYGQKRIVCDETCEIGSETKSSATKGDAGFAVVSPVGRGTVDPINQAPRLNTLSGKTIAVVGVSFMSRVTHPEIKRLIEKNYPDAHVLLLDEVALQDRTLHRESPDEQRMIFSNDCETSMWMPSFREMAAADCALPKRLVLASPPSISAYHR